MELKLIMSGVPNGESYLGPKEDKSYFGNLYAPSEIGKKFDIRLRHNENGNFAYYHYLVYNSLNDCDGRDGAYIGITLRLDNYCFDFRSIYCVLDMIFRKRILGTILKEVNGGRLQFIIRSFDEVSEEINRLESIVKDLLSPVLQKTDITSISGIPNGKNRHNLNIEEATLADVKNIIGQNGYCSISPEYLSRKVENLLTEQYDKGYMSIQSNVESLNKQLASALSKQKELEKTIEKLESGKNTSLSAKNYSENYENIHHTRHSSRHNAIRIVHLILTLLCLFSLGYIIFSQYATTYTEDLTQQEETFSNTSSNLFESEPQVSSGEIYVEGYNEEEGLHKGKEYNVILNNFDGYSNLKLIQDGKCDIIENEGSYSIKVTESEGTIILACVEENYQNTLLQKTQLIIKP